MRLTMTPDQGCCVGLGPEFSQASLPLSPGAQMRRESIPLLWWSKGRLAARGGAQQSAMAVIRYKPAHKENSHEFKSVHR
jgi:hypothetical protein